jgi:hypothetical protein
MTWRDCAKPGDDRNNRNYPPVAHAGRIVWLWHGEHRSSIYDPSADRWTRIPEPFTPPSLRASPAMCSTGEELLIWGGFARSSAVSNGKASSTGARLGKDLTWSPMAERGPSMRSSPTFAWTGSELLVWSGWNNAKMLPSGAAYNPATNAWRKLPNQKTSARREDSLWTGTELWMWDSAVRGEEMPRRGHAYNPEKNEWRDLAILPDDHGWARSMGRCADGAIFVGRESHDVDGCVVWRYEPRADLWEPSAPPPRVPGDPTIVECDGRVIVRIGESIFEYLPAKDAWAEVRSPAVGLNFHLVWLKGELFAFGEKGVRALKLPAETQPLAAERAPIVIPTATAPAFAKGPAVTAIAVVKGKAVAGYEDGSIRLGEKVVRKADGNRITGLVAEPGGWTALIGKQLEGETTAKLAFAGQALAYGDGQLVVAGGGKLVSFVNGKKAESVAAPGTTIHLAVFGGTITRTVLGPEKQGRSEPRDTVEARHTRTLKLILELTGYMRQGTTAAVPVEAGIYLGGAGGYRVALYPHGKKRAADGGLNESSLRQLAVSGDGRWIAGAAWSALKLYSVPDARCALSIEMPDLTAVATDGNVIAFGTEDGVAYAVDRVTLCITAYPPKGKPVILQPPASELLDAKPAKRDSVPRAKPETSKHGIDGWRLWHAGDRFFELTDQTEEMAILPDDSLAFRSRETLVLLSPDGAKQRRFVGHGANIEGFSPAADGKSIVTWDRLGTVRRWSLSQPERE